MKPSYLAMLKPGAIVQLDPEKTENKAFGGCFLTVTEVKAWGVMGFVQALGTREEAGGQAYYRASIGTFEYVGEAMWTRGPAKETEDGE